MSLLDSTALEQIRSPRTEDTERSVAWRPMSSQPNCGVFADSVAQALSSSSQGSAPLSPVLLQPLLKFPSQSSTLAPTHPPCSLSPSGDPSCPWAPSQFRRQCSRHHVPLTGVGLPLPLNVLFQASMLISEN